MFASAINDFVVFYTYTARVRVEGKLQGCAKKCSISFS